MIRLYDKKICLDGGRLKPLDELAEAERLKKSASETMACAILDKHNTAVDGGYRIKFDALISHDITYVAIIQTARASGLTEFPVPYVLTNCHNSLCAVGGTINRDDHMFGMSACKKYGGIFVPANQSIIHSYAREELSGCGRMVLGSDSHTRYGALGTLGVGEGGGELVKQLLGRTYDIEAPKVVAVWLEGKPRHGVGPQDVALALIGATFKNGFVKNKVLEFIGPGVDELSVDFRCGVDVMTTESTCLTSIWRTDGKVKEYFRIHKRPEAYARLEPGENACYDSAVFIDLSEIEPMIALPMHPSNVYTIRELNENAEEILAGAEAAANRQIDNPGLKLDLRGKLRGGRLHADQAEIAGCSGGSYENIVSAARILNGRHVPNEFFYASVYPASEPVMMELVKKGFAADLMAAGVVLKPAFCGPCFGAGDIPANGSLAIRHATRNFPNREGSKPMENQFASVALMDARSIAATIANGGLLTSAADVDYDDVMPDYHFDDSSYRSTVYNGCGKPHPEEELHFGPNIADWPPMLSLQENVLLKVASIIPDPVTTTDELIPSGDASSYRSNPERMSGFTLSRRDPEYVGSAREFRALERARLAGEADPALSALADSVAKALGIADAAGFMRETQLGSIVCSVKPGDGSAREQAASCQRVLGGLANLCVEYATKRYRSNLVNWGLLPFVAQDDSFLTGLLRGDMLYIAGVRSDLLAGKKRVTAKILRSGKVIGELPMLLQNVSPEEADIISAGCLINYYAK